MAYPSTIDSPTTNVDNVDVIYAADVNNLQTHVQQSGQLQGNGTMSSSDYKIAKQKFANISWYIGGRGCKRL